MVGIPTIRIPARAALALARAGDVAQRRGIDPGFSSAAVWNVLHHATFDDRDVREELGIQWRPIADTIRDTVAWLHAQGHVSARQAGRE